MLPQVLIITIFLMALTVAAIAFKYYNKKHFPLCSVRNMDDMQEFSPCMFCGVENVEECKKEKVKKSEKTG